MSTDSSANIDNFCLPASATEAWAEVYIDVAEKLDAEAAGQTTGVEPKSHVVTTQKEDESHPST